MGRGSKTALFLALGLAYAWGAVSLGRVTPPYYDSRQYVEYGLGLLQTHTFGVQPGVPDMNREPGYPAFLAGTFAGARAIGLVPALEAVREADGIFWVKAAQALLLFLCAGLAAFRGALPRRVRVPLFLLAVLSPTCVGTAREIYSEALAIPLSFLALFFLSRAIEGRSWAAAGLAPLMAAMVLTKPYFYQGALLLVPLAAFGIWRHRRISPIALGLLCAGMAGFGAQQAWNARNRALFGANRSEPRLTIAIAGKVARLDRASWGTELPVAFAATLGSNFCDGHFGPELCSLFDYRGCDEIGNAVTVDYRRRFPTAVEAESALKRDMLALWLHRPFTQLFGSGLELVRMGFFEAFLDAGTLPSLLQAPARAWHVLGSLLLWALSFVSVVAWVRRAQEPGFGELLLVCAGALGYHALTMSQITNVVRYVFPVVPFLYLFAADGAARLHASSPWARRRA